MIILAISLVGEILKYILPLPIPASIYGMAILFAGLMSGLIKLDAVRETGKFLIEIMPLMFIPAGVGLMDSWGNLHSHFTARCDHHDRDQHHCHGIHRTAVSMGHPTRKKAGGGKDGTKERGVS